MTGKTYPVGLVGERSFQPAIARCRPGMPVELVREIGNPHDAKALRIDAAGATIGYLARDSWVRDAVHAQNKTIDATIQSIEGGSGKRGVVLAVTLVAGLPPSAEWKPTVSRRTTTAAPSRSKSRSVWAGIFAGLFASLGKRRR